MNVWLRCGFRLGNKRQKPVRVIHSDIGQHFAIQHHTGALQSADETAVRDVGNAAGGIDSHNPKRTEVPLLEPASYITVLQRLLNGFLRRPVQLRLSKKESLGSLKGLVAVIPPIGTTFNSRHVFSFIS